jgi:hypothetical protein
VLADLISQSVNENKKQKVKNKMQLKRNIIIAAILAVVGIGITCHAQTNQLQPVPQDSFLSTFGSYFTSLNPSLASTFATAGTNAERGEFWIGAAIQNNKNIGNMVGASYNIGKSFSVEACTLNDGILNTIDTQELGVGYNLVMVDTKLTASVLGGYRFAGSQAYGAIAVAVKKALTTHTFAGLRVEVQTGGKTDYVPIVAAMTGFNF